MTKLTAKARKALPDSDFAVIEKTKVKNKKTGKITTKKTRRFPINDKNHARLALAMKDKAHGIDKGEKAQIVKKAKKKLKTTDKKDSMSSLKRKYKG